MFILVLLFLMFPFLSYGSTTTDVVGDNRDAKWREASQSTYEDTRQSSGDGATLDTTATFLSIEDSSAPAITRSLMVFDTSYLGTHYIVNAKFILTSIGNQPITNSDIAGFTVAKSGVDIDNLKATNYADLRDSVDNATEIAQRKSINGKGTVTSLLYPSKFVYSINKSGFTLIGVNHEYDLDGLEHIGSDLVSFHSGNHATVGNRPVLRITDCTNCVHIQGLTQIKGLTTIQ